MEKFLDINEIKKIIPHRYPFLLVDKITELEEGKMAVGYKNVTANEYFFNGHFPEEPVMPGVLIIEALAQVGAVAILSKDGFKGKIAYFGGINKAKFRKKVIPGDVLKLSVELTKIKGVAGVGKAIATVDGKVAAEAELLFVIGK
ncbi:3-hydroxyacyl-ACP dehydratase FabZ [Clostridium sporogenes]|uniref:3-hydroxyacyl-[acyl-carrier-protein] dehydratase FabZ n=1 Tax=Clostridium botulinum TaxID=1491 RepID=A0A6M0T3H5_CLOBO|nr:3-hydroxyacyl-ACP dehydratase FabZ [Clostridium sporogenes]NFA61964.1 3-hydroxyacyl-ACP dehydratase FabZ [Clostridium botulinum]NFI75105.1 3-hydroxyacyl-ACP dehydratase FabZ [Clostridium sporogenes]NFL72041.1 3-hydroxyacyl-ACP dehydratase FabZ [Clostridium sporogenes]NFM25073.1 3-hydroxyacyl-ACP dehydratase FabZ [Clostridium sporogenes]NFP63298.1 3-hydroxyacyl-ACP dehydratase FabZ [Clostridium sporogenes]